MIVHFFNKWLYINTLIKSICPKNIHLRTELYLQYMYTTHFAYNTCAQHILFTIRVHYNYTCAHHNLFTRDLKSMCLKQVFVKQFRNIQYSVSFVYTYIILRNIHLQKTLEGTINGTIC